MIQNRAYIQYLEDGNQLHYELRSNKSLTQALSKVSTQMSCVPDWTVAANQPTVFLSLQNGSTPIAPDSDNQVWKYNGTVITFDPSTNLSTNQDFAGVFQKTTYTVGGLSMPALKIVGNLATLSGVVDIDIIEFSGQKTLSSNSVSFGCSIFVQISELIKGGYVGTLEFLDGKANIDTENGTVTLISNFYAQTGETITEGQFTRKWYLNDVEITSTTVSTTAAYLTNSGTRMVVPEKAVTDYAMAKCEYYVPENGVQTLRFTAYAGIDDTQDPQYMWIRNSLGGGQAIGNAASLRSGDTVIFQSYIGRAGDQTTIDANYTKFYVKLLDAEKQVIMDGISGVPNAHTTGDYAGFRDITTTVSSGTPTGTMGEVSIPYSSKTLAKNGMTLIFLAATTNIW